MVVAILVAAPARAATWSADFTITDSEVHDSFTSFNNQRVVAADDSNNVYIALFDDRSRIPSDDNFEIYFRRFVYNFGSPALTRVTTAPNMSKYPTIAIRNWGLTDDATREDSGRVYVAWQDARLYPIPLTGEPSSYSIYLRTFQSRGGVGFGPEIQISPTDSMLPATSPALALGDAGQVFVFWQQAPSLGSSPDIYYAVYDAEAMTVGPSAPLSSDPAFSGSCTATATPDGVVFVAWTDTRSGKLQIWTKRYIPGFGWTLDDQATFSPTSASQPSIAADYKGNVHLVWVDTRDGNNEIYYTEFVDGVGWDPFAQRLTLQTSSQFQPSVDADPHHNVYVVWTDLRNGSSNPDIFFKTRQNSIWLSDEPLVDAASDPSNSVQRFPAIGIDRTGRAYVAWSDERLRAGSVTNKEVFYKYGTDVVTSAGSSTPARADGGLRSYPNPFNPATTISFSVERAGRVTLKVYDVWGRHVRTLVDETLAAGPREFSWDGRDGIGAPLPTGIYFVRMQDGGRTEVKKINLLK